MSYEEIIDEINQLTASAANTADGAVKLLKAAQPLLKELVDLCGAADHKTVNAATLVAQKAINATISGLNAASRHLIAQLKAEPDNKEALIDAYIKHLDVSEMIVSVLYKLPVSDEFRTARLDLQISRLKSLIGSTDKAKARYLQKAAAPTPDTAEPPIAAAERQADDEPRRKRHPWGWAVIACIALVIGYATVYIIDVLHEKSQLAAIKADYTEEGIMDYLSDKDNTYYSAEAVNLYLSHMDSILLNPRLMAQPTQYPPLVRMDNFSRQPDITADAQAAIAQRVRLRSDSLYALALNDNTIEAWYWFQSLAPTQYYHDSNERIDSLQALAWSAEPTAWQLAQTNDDREAYSHYLELYPQGEHSQAAEGKLIDIEVNAYRNRSNAAIKSIDRLEALHGDKSVVYISNKTGHDMQFMFSGPTSCKMTVAPGKSGSVKIDNGRYRILVIISGFKSDRFTFTQDFESAIYSSSITIDD